MARPWVQTSIQLGTQWGSKMKRAVPGALWLPDSLLLKPTMPVYITRAQKMKSLERAKHKILSVLSVQCQLPSLSFYCISIIKLRSIFFFNIKMSLFFFFSFLTRMPRHSQGSINLSVNKMGLGSWYRILFWGGRRGKLRKFDNVPNPKPKTTLLEPVELTWHKALAEKVVVTIEKNKVRKS